ncbi:dolichyl-P-Man:Man(7)GlcNAc(2)-PP-dolichol alpha-1,6-mannosyltransferase [Nowakowskiella sp. JEL0407]|nr:dolichyl-P-Man:Man(7)GlcNAc(2)-PP-dolichol alpha-1,6-mannosyltransferase [Nowakowskiella sp. JEL0407]
MAVRATALLYLLVSGLCLLAAPYSKVEESFSLQAVHDLLRESLSDYDHFLFPGVVPRSFVPSLLLSLLSYPFAFFINNNFVLLYVVRSLLAILQSLSLYHLLSAAEKRFGKTAALWAGVFNFAQFHLPYWGSRTLPNFFALIPINFAFAIWLSHDTFFTTSTSPETTATSPPTSKKPTTTQPPKTYKELTTPGKLLISLLAFTAIILRCETVLLSFPILISETFIYKSLPLLPLLEFSYVASLSFIALTISIDSYFWKTPMFWPEFRVFLFNVVYNGAASYGVSPFHTYVTNLIPRIAPGSFPLALVAGLVREDKVRRYMAPLAAFVGVYSMLGHKEWRFVVYVVPMLNVFAGVAVAHILDSREKFKNEGDDSNDSVKSLTSGVKVAVTSPKKRPVSSKKIKITNSRVKATLESKSNPKRPLENDNETEEFNPYFKIFFKSAITLFTCLLFLGSMFSVYVSSLNYPGGVALTRLHTLAAPHTNVSVHIDTYSAMTGVSRFVEVNRNRGWTYFKNETLAKREEYFGFDYLVTHTPELHIEGYLPEEASRGDGVWEVLEVVKGYVGLKYKFGGLLQWVREVLKRVLTGRFEWDPKSMNFGLPFVWDIEMDDLVWILKRRK